ncbi:hypothetical protein SELMODRAFT_440571 [Selaginella moellendorffii]|uniref:DHHA2 domain-containing protein n=2 Tax=Selaginella moellendorffii TaxID=88036 RepID=D8RCK9_SELML|nr:hypothetical protein SELMODRAFT_440571 [Selaginella moellendorffii]
MGSKFLQKRMKESPYYIGHNTTTKRAEISPYSVDVEDIYETLYVKQNGGGTADHSPYIATHEEGENIPDFIHINLENETPSLPKLSRQYSTKQHSITNASQAASDTFERGGEIQSRFELSIDQADASNSSSTIGKAPPVSSESFEAVFRPRNNVNRLLTSCAMSSTRNALTVSGVAAAFYNGGWLPPAPAPDHNVLGINEFIAEVRGEIESGLPGRSLTVVLGSYFPDLDSVVSTIAYAYFLHTKRESQNHCIVPVVNMKRSDLQIHTEIDWLFKAVQLDVESLVFSDEISLTYYHRFGNLRLVLVDHKKLEPVHESLGDVIVETLEHSMVGSCCTLVAEKFASEAPKLLQGRGLSRLLLAGILIDTCNLDLSIGQCSSRDVAMATLLLNGAGRYGRNGFFKMLRKRVSDLSVLSPREILNKQIEVWTSAAGSSGRIARIGMCAMGIALSRFLTVETGVSDELVHLQRSKKLDILLVLTSYYDKSDKFKRELLIATEGEGLLQTLVESYNTAALQLHPMDIIGRKKKIFIFLL